jgi:hypothetical protein
MTILSAMLPWFVYPKILATGGTVHAAIIVAAADSNSGDTLKVSLVAGCALVLAAAVPNLLALFKKPAPVVPITHADERLVTTLEKAVETTRARIQVLLGMVEERDREIDRLQRMIVKLGADPFPLEPLTEESQP